MALPGRDPLGGSGGTSPRGTYCETTFYSDATYTTIVGERIKNCDGSVYTWGTISPYKIFACEACGP